MAEAQGTGVTRDRQKHSAGSETPAFVPPLQRAQHTVAWSQYPTRSLSKQRLIAQSGNAFVKN